MRKITITEALVELKLLDSRIKKAIAKKWCYAVKKNEMDKTDELKKDIKSNYQSVLDLIQERQKIKAASLI